MEQAAKLRNVITVMESEIVKGNNDRREERQKDVNTQRGIHVYETTTGGNVDIT
jgi:hypothetical protein